MPYTDTQNAYPDVTRGLTSFGRRSRPVTPSDTTDLSPYAKAIVALSSGNLVLLPVENADGVTVTFTSVPVGFVPPFEVRRVLATGTTATVATVD
jgi:hypothetical protein